MKRIELLEIAERESIPSGHTITGYCSVSDISTCCTRDQVYLDTGGRVSDCNFAEERTKSSCEHWHRIKALKVD